MDIIEKLTAEHGRIHFIGIGGIMMSALALELKRRGACVTGNDRDESDTVQMLRNSGIPVKKGHFPEAVEGADLIVRNAAIKDSSPDMLRAAELGIPVMERPALLGRLMKDYRYPICVAGTHGKSTTSAMLTHALIKTGNNPTAFIGAVLPEIGGAYTLGGKDYFVAESCEYCDSFLNLFPHTAVILNTEPDHLDYFSGIEQIIASFRKFALLTPVDGRVAVNADSENAMKAVAGIDRETVTFGLKSGYYRAENISFEHGYAEYDLCAGGERLTRISLGVPGLHNVYNSLAVAAAMRGYGIGEAAIAGGIASFNGVLRRFQRVGKYRGADVVDDYAHHPSELAATLATARSMGYKRVICCFQPHTYTRTAALLPEFAAALSSADRVIVTDIYAAREVNTTGISGANLASGVPGAEYIPSLSGCAERLRALASEGDIILTCGAGSITEVAGMTVGNKGE